MGKKVLDWFTKHKVLMGLVIGFLVVIIGCAVFVLPKILAAKVAQKAGYSYVRTTTLTKTSLDNTVTVNGTVEASDTATVTVAESAKTYKVAEIRVEVGDKVQAGDVVAVLDTTDVLDSIEQAKKTYNENVESAQTTYDRAVSSYEVAVVQHQNKLIDYQTAIEEADKKLSDAQSKQSDANSTKNSAQSKYDTLNGYLNSAKTEIQSYQTTYDTALTTLNNATAALVTEMTIEELQQKSPDDPDLNDTERNYLTALEACNTAEENLNLIKQDVSFGGYTGYDAIEKATTEASNALTNAKTALDNANSSVTSAEQNVKNAHDNYDNEKNTTSLTSSYNQVEDAKTKLTQAKENTENLDKLYNTLDKCTLTATMSGTITSIGAVVGSACASTDAVATIKNVNGLKVTVTIPADSVPEVSVGMHCNITSDATEDTISGTLTQIDPTANSSGSFGATVTVDGENTGLLVGIQAQVEIVESSVDGVFVVPIDAVGTADDGSSYVLRKTGGEGTDMTFEEVTVTVGNENGYYCEISGDGLSEGDVIRSSADLTAGIVDSDNGTDEEDGIFVDMGGGDDMGGGPGGDMGGGGAPSGGAPSGGGGGAPGGM